MNLLNLRTLAVAVVLVILVGGAARAAELYTPWLLPVNQEFVQCRIVNTSAVAQTVRIRFYNDHSAVIFDGGNFLLEPRGSLGLIVNVGAYCRFTTVSAKTVFRASISVFDSTNGRTTVALPAQ